MSEEEYEVEKILDVKKRKRNPLYLIRWKGYGPESDSWEPRENLINCDELLENFNANLPIKKSLTPKKSSFNFQVKKLPTVVAEVEKERESTPMCNGVTSSHSAVAELVISSLDISPLHLKDKYGRYPTISEIRNYATQKSLAKLNSEDKDEDEIDDSTATQSSTKSFGYYVVVSSFVVFILGVIWALLLWALNLQPTGK